MKLVLPVLRAGVLLLLVCGAAHGAAPAFQDDGRAARVQAMLPGFDKMYTELAAKEHLPGLVYGVVMDGKLIHQRALGLANVEDKIAVTSQTRFRIASMSKSFVALAALKLRDAGKLRLDDPASRYLPELRNVRLPTADSPPLTVRMLMTMTTGLPEDNPWGDRQMALSGAAVARFVGSGLSFSNAPGQVFEYSNLGYVLLGKVVSKVAGMRFQDYLQRELFMPLGMKNTGWEYGDVPAAELALGYRWTGSGWEREPMLHDGDAAAMGGLLTTMDDFARYVALHLDAWPARDDADTGPVRRATLREMHLPQVFAGMNARGMTADRLAPNPSVSFYSYGMQTGRDSQGTVIAGHSGGLPGFGSQFRFAPHHGVGVFAFTNLRYGPVYGPTGKMLVEMIQRGKLPARVVAPSAILLARQQQVAQLVQSWDEGLGRSMTAENFFLDRSRQDWIVEARGKLDKIGKVMSVGPMTAENQLRGAFPLIGERGSVQVAFTLSPEKEPKMQELNIEVAAEPAAEVRVTKQGYIAFGQEVAAFDALLKRLTEKGVRKVMIRIDADASYEDVGKLIYGGMRQGIETEVVADSPAGK